MFVVGITGGIGSGKSAVTDHLETLGITVVDADKVARVVVEPGTPGLAAIAEHFGTDILLADGGLDRAALRKIVFDNPDERKVLEGITHPRIRDEIARQLSEANSPYVVLSSPLLLESGQNTFADYVVVVVDVPEEVQLTANHGTRRQQRGSGKANYGSAARSANASIAGRHVDSE